MMTLESRIRLALERVTIDADLLGILLAKLKRLDLSGETDVNWQKISRSFLSPDIPFFIHQLMHDTVFSDWPRNRGPRPGWFPEDVSNSNIEWLRQKVQVDDCRSLQAWSVEDHATFLEYMVERLAIPFHESPTGSLSVDEQSNRTDWFPDGRLNIAESCLENWDGQATAVTVGRNDGRIERFSHDQLRGMVGRVFNSLRRMGMEPGDAIGLDLPMTFEAVALFLGVIAAGCRAVTVADSFATPEIRIRFELGQVRCVFTQDVICRGDRRIPLYEKVRSACDVPLIVLPESENITVNLQDGDVDWNEFLKDEESFRCVSCRPDEMTTLLFSSGTTGAPKAIPWDHSTPCKCAFDAHLHHDTRPGDVLCWPTSLGWMMGPWLVYAAFMNRAGLALYLDTPTDAGFPAFVKEAGVTMLGVVPTLVQSWRRSGILDGVDWRGIRAFSSTGECSQPEDMLFLMSRAGYRPVIEYCGGTEIGGGYISGTVVQPSAPATFSLPAFGNRFVILDESGQAAENGEVFLTPPAIGLSQTLLNADHDSVYTENTPAGPGGSILRRHGDGMLQLPGGYYRAQGRVDDAMNLGGIKVSATCIEEVVAKLPSVTESAAISVMDPQGGPTRLVLYVVADGSVEASHLQDAAQQIIRRELNPLFKVYEVIIVPALPRTASNKVMRRTLRRQYGEKSERP